MAPDQLAKLRKNRSEKAAPLPPLRVVDHRALAGLPEPPREHVEPCPTMQHRNQYLTALRRSVHANGGRVSADKEGTIHVR